MELWTESPLHQYEFWASAKSQRALSPNGTENPYPVGNDDDDAVVDLTSLIRFGHERGDFPYSKMQCFVPSQPCPCVDTQDGERGARSENDELKQLLDDTSVFRAIEVTIFEGFTS